MWFKICLNKQYQILQLSKLGINVRTKRNWLRDGGKSGQHGGVGVMHAFHLLALVYKCSHIPHLENFCT